VSLASQQQVLAARVAALQVRSALLRQAMAADAQVLRTPLALVDGLCRTGALLRAQPHWLVLAGAALVAWRPRASWRWAARGWRAWRWWRRSQRWLSAPRPGP